VKVIVAGGSGFIGKILVERLLSQNHQVVVLSRRTIAFNDALSENLKVEPWDAKASGSWARQLEDADAVVNLSGAGIADKRWTRERKMILRDSRLDSTRILVSSIHRCVHKPKVLVNASAVGYYGTAVNTEVTEDSPQGKGFLADLCGAWEAEAKKAQTDGTRVVLVRTGIVLEKEGGALQKFILPFRFFVGGPLGSGNQYFPWIHRDDALGAILYCLENSTVSGPVNVTAPEVLTMKEFCRVLGQTMGRPSWAPVPEFVLKILLGEMTEMLVTGQRAVPKRLQSFGYHFQFSHATEALRDIFNS
jgi:uncharacterized protein (TIGR01777 family)